MTAAYAVGLLSIFCVNDVSDHHRIHLADCTIACMGCGRKLDMTKNEAWHGIFCFGDKATLTVEGYLVIWHCSDCDPWEIADRLTHRQRWHRTPADAWKVVQGTSP